MTSHRIERKIRHLYGFSVLRFLGQFVTAMAAHPLNRWGEGNLHPFVANVIEAQRRCGISEDGFKQWQDDVIKSFETRNAFALSSEKMINTQMNGRNLLEMHSNMLNL
eukprot:scaffold16323_cov250-Cylindrotheca_fusiformis.AAC.1